MFSDKVLQLYRLLFNKVKTLFFLLTSLDCYLFNIVSLIYYLNLYKIRVLQCFALTSDAVPWTLTVM